MLKFFQPESKLADVLKRLAQELSKQINRAEQRVIRLRTKKFNEQERQANIAWTEEDDKCCQRAKGVAAYMRETLQTIQQSGDNTEKKLQAMITHVQAWTDFRYYDCQQLAPTDDFLWLHNVGRQIFTGKLSKHVERNPAFETYFDAASEPIAKHEI